LLTLTALPQVSDTFPIGGRSRSPYIAMAAAVGLAAYFTLALGVVNSQLGLGVVLLLTNLAQASPDVMIDASVAESSKRHPLYAADLQVRAFTHLDGRQ
jgi:hypothetical protein